MSGKASSEKDFRPRAVPPPSRLPSAPSTPRSTVQASARPQAAPGSPRNPPASGPGSNQRASPGVQQRPAADARTPGQAARSAGSAAVRATATGSRPRTPPLAATPAASRPAGARSAAGTRISPSHPSSKGSSAKPLSAAATGPARTPTSKFTAGAPPRTPGSTPQPPRATPRPLMPLPNKAAPPTTSSSRAAAGDRIAAIRSPRQPSASMPRGAAGRGRLAASCGRSAASPAAGGGRAAAAPAVGKAALVPAASGRSAGTPPAQAAASPAAARRVLPAAAPPAAARQASISRPAAVSAFGGSASPRGKAAPPAKTPGKGTAAAATKGPTRPTQVPPNGSPGGSSVGSRAPTGAPGGAPVGAKAPPKNAAGSGHIPNPFTGRRAREAGGSSPAVKSRLGPSRASTAPALPSMLGKAPVSRNVPSSPLTAAALAAAKPPLPRPQTTGSSGLGSPSVKAGASKPPLRPPQRGVQHPPPAGSSEQQQQQQQSPAKPLPVPRLRLSSDWLSMRTSLALQDLPQPPKLALEQPPQAPHASPASPRSPPGPTVGPEPAGGSPQIGRSPRRAQTERQGVRAARARASEANWLDLRTSAAFLGLELPPEITLTEAGTSGDENQAQEQQQQQDSSTITAECDQSPQAVQQTATLDESPMSGDSAADPLTASPADDESAQEVLSQVYLPDPQTPQGGEAHGMAVTPSAAASEQSLPQSAVRSAFKPLSLGFDEAAEPAADAVAASSPPEVQEARRPVTRSVTKALPDISLLSLSDSSKPPKPPRPAFAPSPPPAAAHQPPHQVAQQQDHQMAEPAAVISPRERSNKGGSSKANGRGGLQSIGEHAHVEVSSGEPGEAFGSGGGFPGGYGGYSGGVMQSQEGDDWLLGGARASVALAKLERRFDWQR